MTRGLTVLAAALTTTFASTASSQDFNAAPPNAPHQQSAFEGQTRAPVLADDIALETRVIADGLDHPWGIAGLPDGTWLVTERAGNLRRIAPDGAMSDPISGLPEVDARGQGGLLDVLLAPDFDSSRRIYWSYAEPREGGNATAVASGTLNADLTAVEDAQVIFQQQPAYDGDKHFGSRLVWGDDGMLFITTGERSDMATRGLSQDVTTHLGKVLRIRPEGGAAEGNPPIPNGQPEIWSWGHRNIQSAAMGPDGNLWVVEHGAKGGDEVNLVRPGRNYGWPIITYGVEYSGDTIGEGETAREGMEQPVYYWDPVIAPSGMAFYEGEMFPEWQGDILVGGLVAQALVRLQIEGERVTGEARHLQGIGRVRDVEVQPDGSLVIVTDEDDGQLIHVTRQ